MTYRSRLLSPATTFVLAAAVAAVTFAARAEIPAATQLAATDTGSSIAVKAAVAISPALENSIGATAKAAVPDAAVEKSVAVPPVAATEKAVAVSPPCSAPAELTRLGQPLSHTARLLAAGAPIKIVAIGSSSTAGAGASSPAASYPSRLAIELAQRLPKAQFTVLNRGVNGEEAAEMLARFDTSVIVEKPDLVLWQVGTNAVLRDQPLLPASTLIQEGVARLKAAGADVILIDPQFAPKVIAKTEAKSMVKLIATAAKQYSVNLFQRFAVMRHWRERDGMSFDTFVSPDQLHMNDWSYACVAKVLSVAIAEAATRPTVSAAVQPRRH
jgi:lysophospholipase L1-like esterase